MQIQWFPGHMAKARRQVEEKLSIVDIVIELVDARAPASSENPMLQEIIKDKKKIMILMKKDLADPKATNKWLNHFRDKNIPAIAINVNDKKDIKSLIQLASKVGEEQKQKWKKKGVQAQAIRAMVLGIPNVGKSSLINRLANKKVANIGNRPGITKQQLWIKVNKDFELLDTPGILWPKFEDEKVGYRLAAIGTIKDQLLSLEDIVAFFLTFMQENYPSLLEKRYNITADMNDMWEIFEQIGKQRGALESGGHVNFSRVAEIVLQDLRTGRIGNITLEDVEERADAD